MARDISSAPQEREWLGSLAGKFIVFDGPDGSGKSTQFSRFSKLASDSGLGVCEVREPGGTHVGERIRSILLDPIHDEMAPRCEMMLYMASRAQLVEERIRPAMAKNQLVLADRFLSSTLAYQGAAGGLPREEIMHVAQAALGVPGSTGAAWPDLVIVFDVDEQTAASRLNPLLDRMERKSAEFHARVRGGYLDQARRDPDHYLVVDARADADIVAQRLLGAMAERFTTAS